MDMKTKNMAFMTFVTLTAALGGGAEPGEQWVASFQGDGDSVARAHAQILDPLDGGLYVVGESGDWNSGRLAVVKFDPDGKALWSARRDGPSGGAGAMDVATLDGGGNLVIAGQKPTDSPFWTLTVVSYSPAGVERWAVVDGDAGTMPQMTPKGIAAVPGGVVVAGHDESSDSLFVLKIGGDGTILWKHVRPGAIGRAVAADDEGNAFVTGRSASSLLTLKLSPEGRVLWEERSLPGYGKAISRNGAGEIFIAGESPHGSTTGYIVACLTPEGRLHRSMTYWPWENNHSAGNIALDREGAIIVTGWSGVGTSSDIATVKFASDGRTLWAKRYDKGGFTDEPRGMAVDPDGNIYITGQSFLDPSGLPRQIVTLKYDPDGRAVWKKEYHAKTDSQDDSAGIAVDSAGAVYVTGTMDKGEGKSFVTIKYSTRFVRGDVDGKGGRDIADVISLLGWMFLAGPALPCHEAADANDDGGISIVDPVALLRGLFGAGFEIPAPAGCGVDPTSDALGCGLFDGCS
jgi:beta-propeller repeat-containing protein